VRQARAGTLGPSDQSGVRPVVGTGNQEPALGGL
jgi:hypothetical protein